MAVILGTDGFRYEVVDDWANLPDGWNSTPMSPRSGSTGTTMSMSSAAAPHPMMVFDRDGNFLRSWGEGVFHRPHGVHMAADDTIFLTDDGDHTVRKCTLEGRVLLTIGVPASPHPI